MTRTLPILAALALGLGCSEASYNAARTGSYATDYSTGTGTGTGTGGTTLPPETETDAFFELPPAQTDTFVFVANPDRDTVTRVNVDTLQVRTTDVGVDPRIVLTTPDYQTAVVFNRGDDSVSILEASTLSQQRVDVRDNFNQMRMSPDGLFVVLWHDVAAERPDDPPAEGLQSFNEASLVDVTSGAHWPMAVGFNPRDVVFTPNGATAAIVSDEYLAIVDLTSAQPSPSLIRLTDVVDPPEAQEVVLSPGGDYAFVRQFGATDVLVVDLLSQAVTAIPVGTNPTDLDLTPDGAEAVVVDRGGEALVILDVADPFATPTTLALPAGESFGSVVLDPTGENGVIYTTASLNRRYATWHRPSGRIELHAMVKPVDKLAITPTGDTLLVFHPQEDAPDADPDSPFLGEWALTVISLVDFRTNPLLLPAEPIDFANGSDGTLGYFVMEEQRFLEKLDYVTLLHDEIPLDSNPVFVGVLPDLAPEDGVPPKAWVSQEHDLGRISFLDPTDDSLETITGFELNSEIGD